jgi:hypothetical protein
MRSIQSLIKLSPALPEAVLLAGPAPATADTACCRITVPANGNVVLRYDEGGGNKMDLILTFTIVSSSSHCP